MLRAVVVARAAVPAAGQIKWNPGHYMASYGIVRGGGSDFSVIDDALARLKTRYNKPKRLVVVVFGYSPRPYT